MKLWKLRQWTSKQLNIMAKLARVWNRSSHKAFVIFNFCFYLNSISTQINLDRLHVLVFVVVFINNSCFQLTRPGTLTERERRAMRGFMANVISNIVPESMKQDFLEHYTCCPPPLFMPIISVIEVQMNTELPNFNESNHTKLRSEISVLYL